MARPCVRLELFFGVRVTLDQYLSWRGPGGFGIRKRMRLDLRVVFWDMREYLCATITTRILQASRESVA